MTLPEATDWTPRAIAERLSRRKDKLSKAALELIAILSQRCVQLTQQQAQSSIIIKKPPDMKGVLVCLPAGYQIVSAHTSGIIYSIGQMLTAAGIPSQLLWFAMTDIVEVRNVFVTKFYDQYPSASHLLFIDADMYFPPQLVARMIELDKPIVGTVYSRRELPRSPIGHPLGDEKDYPIVNGFQRWKHLGCGLMLIKVSVIEEMMKKLPVVDSIDPGALEKAGVTRILRVFDRLRDQDGSWLSEDFSFCERWHQLGGEIWANVDTRIEHIGSFNYGYQWSEREHVGKIDEFYVARRG